MEQEWQPRNDRERGLHERARKAKQGLDCKLQYAALPMVDRDGEPTVVSWPFLAPEDLAPLLIKLLVAHRRQVCFSK